MKSAFQLFLATLLVTLLATKVCNARDIPDREIRQDGAKEPGEMTNALNYLAELDKYYSNAARPRYVTLWPQTEFQEFLFTTAKCILHLCIHSIGLSLL